MGREVRRVPANWEHPRNADGSHIPLYGDSFAKRLADWEAAADLFARGLWKCGTEVEPLPTDYAGSFVEWHGERPIEEDFMPDWPATARTHWQMYESTTEGTPISPVMATPEALARWLANPKNGATTFADMTADYETWLRMILRGAAPSMVMDGSGEIRSGVEFVADAEKP